MVFYLTHTEYIALLGYFRMFIGEEKYQSNIFDAQIKGRENSLISWDALSFEYTVGPIYDPPKDKFIDSDSDVGKLLKLVTDDNDYVDKMTKRVILLRKLKEKIIDNLGDSGVVSGFITVNLEDITHINSFDAILRSQKSEKYVKSLLKYPEWVTAWN